MAEPTQAIIDEFVGNAHGIPVLYHAVIRNHEDIAELLLAHGADVNFDEGKNPAIHGAVLFRQPAMVEWLVAHGANVNAKNHEELTPLAVAVKQENTLMADFLRRYGGIL